ncbi:hypothetical protein C8Q74DRAFT_1293489 [Fomes fomentarius]|nr:hypothetical protein C8Q74DRAFT_1293489 [Fomes fomentarius]
MDSLVLTRRCAMGARALFLYDYLLTLDLEVEYFWRTRTTGATILFFANRYTNIFVSVLNIGIQLVETKSNTFSSEPSVNSCQVLEMMFAAHLVLAQLLLALFSTLRVYALTNRSFWPPAIVFAVASLSPAILIYTYIHSAGFPAPSPEKGCGLHTLLSPVKYDMLIIIARISVVLCDLLVIIAVLRFVGMPCTRTTVGAHNVPITISLMNNSELMLLLNSAQIIASAFHVTPSPPLINPPHRLTSIFISRMLISLRAANRTLDDDFLSLFVRDVLSELRFASAPGSASASAASLELSPLEDAPPAASRPSRLEREGRILPLRPLPPRRSSYSHSHSHSGPRVSLNLARSQTHLVFPDHWRGRSPSLETRR